MENKTTLQRRIRFLLVFFYVRSCHERPVRDPFAVGTKLVGTCDRKGGSMGDEFP